MLPKFVSLLSNSDRESNLSKFTLDGGTNLSGNRSDFAISESDVSFVVVLLLEVVSDLDASLFSMLLLS